MIKVDKEIDFELSKLRKRIDADRGRKVVAEKAIAKQQALAQAQSHIQQTRDGLELSSAPGLGLILIAPNRQKWMLSLDDEGVLITERITHIVTR